MDQISFECPKCKHQFKRSRAGLKEADSVTCPICGEVEEFNLDAYTAALKEVEKSLGKAIKRGLRGSKRIKLK